MRQAVLPNGKTISRVGIGGHYARMEEGSFEETYALVSPEEVSRRRAFLEAAFQGGVNYFDTTWRNEVEMLARSLGDPGVRGKIHINGMVLGAFRGAKATGLSVEEYFDKWLDDRLRLLGGPFGSMMVNAIEEDYDEALCQRLIPLLERRREAGDFSLFGFSCHNVALARQVADRFPQFRIIMVPYNFYNRAFEEAFAGYGGEAAIIAMKPLVWLEYGVPFAALNDLPGFEAAFGFPPDRDIATKALRFVLEHPLVTAVVSGINSESQAVDLVAAGESPLRPSDQDALERYRLLQQREEGIPLFLGATVRRDSRMNYFAIKNLYRVLGEALPPIPLNEPGTQDVLSHHISLLHRRLGGPYGL